MAKAAALPAGDAPAPKKGPSLVVQGGVLVGITVLALGMGWFTGTQIGPPGPAGEEVPAHAAVGEHGAAAGGDHGGGGEGEAAAPPPGFPTIIPLAPINTNLAAPTDAWVRMELSLEFAHAPEAGVADSVHQDLLDYARSLKLHQIEGPSGIAFLRADMDERARLRSGGKVSRVLIRTLLFE